jgi:ethanolamine utilization protein EutQ
VTISPKQREVVRGGEVIMVMAKVASGVRGYTPDDVQTWQQSEQRQVFIGDVVDGSKGEAMGVGFARYAPGASNEWKVTYDEVLIVTSGSFSVISAGGRQTAKAGELIYLRKGTELTYAAGGDGAELVYVMYPQYASAVAELEAERPDLVATFHPIPGAPERFADGPTVDHVALLRRIWDPFERDESADLGPFFDALADDIEFVLSATQVLRGKEAVRRYFEEEPKLMEAHPFERALQYFSAGNRVVQVGFETFRVERTGKTHQADWAWVYEFRKGRIARILVIQDLSGIEDVVAEAASAAKAVTVPTAKALSEVNP